MIYACDTNTIYLTNPLESKSIKIIMNELSSESTLLIRSSDVVKRFLANKSNLVDLLILKNYSNEEKKKWYDLNVLGQVLNVLREQTINCESFKNNLTKQNDCHESLNQTSFEEVNTSDLYDIRIENSMTNIKNKNQITSNSPHLSHISIPASYKAGITLFAYRESELFKEILSEQELPIRK